MCVTVTELCVHETAQEFYQSLTSQAKSLITRIKFTHERVTVTDMLCVQETAHEFCRGVQILRLADITTIWIL